MAKFADIRAKLASLQDDSLWGIAEIICDLEQTIEDQGETISHLENQLRQVESGQ